jgi:hypothetical protein
MRHIKIYEEYSDDDLNDLIGDLSGVGHKHKLVQGEDFGFGPDLKGKNDGKTLLFLTQWALNQLEKTDLIYKSDKTELTWSKWPEYKGSHYDRGIQYDRGIPVPKLRRAEDLTSLEYPPKTGFFVRQGNRESIVDKNLWFVSLYSARTGRNFPLNSFDSSNMFISSKKVAPVYDIVVDKLKNVNI